MANTLSNMTHNVSENLKTGLDKVVTLESRATRIPPIAFVNLAIGSMVLSAGLAIFSERKTWSNFVGLWAPSFLLFGVYNRLVGLEKKKLI